MWGYLSDQHDESAISFGGDKTRSACGWRMYLSFVADLIHVETSSSKCCRIQGLPTISTTVPLRPRNDM